MIETHTKKKKIYLSQVGDETQKKKKTTKIVILSEGRDKKKKREKERKKKKERERERERVNKLFEKSDSVVVTGVVMGKGLKRFIS